MEVKKVKRSYDLPENLEKMFCQWAAPSGKKSYSPKVAGALFHYMTLDAETQKECEKLSCSPDLENVFLEYSNRQQVASASIKIDESILPIQPEEKAILLSDKDLQRLLKAAIKYRAAQITPILFRYINQALKEYALNLAKEIVRDAEVEEAKMRKKKRGISSKSG